MRHRLRPNKLTQTCLVARTLEIYLGQRFLVYLLDINMISMMRRLCNTLSFVCIQKAKQHKLNGQALENKARSFNVSLNSCVGFNQNNLLRLLKRNCVGRPASAATTLDDLRRCSLTSLVLSRSHPTYRARANKREFAIHVIWPASETSLAACLPINIHERRVQISVLCSGELMKAFS